MDHSLAIQEDQLRIHPISATLTNSTPNEERAAAYLYVKTLRLHGDSVAVASYIPAPEGAIKGIFNRASSFKGSNESLQELRARNLGMEINARRIGKSRHFQYYLLEIRSGASFDTYTACTKCSPKRKTRSLLQL